MPSIVPIGGQHITNDIARGLSTTIAHAERMKTMWGSAISSLMDERETVAVPLLGERGVDTIHQVPRSMLTGIIRPRLEEIFELVRDRLEQAGCARLGGGRVVLTGGASQLSGVREVAAQWLDRQVRLGVPTRLAERPRQCARAGVCGFNRPVDLCAPAGCDLCTTNGLFRGWRSPPWLSAPGRALARRELLTTIAMRRT